MRADANRFVDPTGLLEPLHDNPETSFLIHKDTASGSRMRIRHVTVKTYGNTAVVTGYKWFNIALADGSIIRGTVRVSDIWTKQQGKWKVVHSHDSPLKTAPRERISPPQESTNGR